MSVQYRVTFLHQEPPYLLEVNEYPTISDSFFYTFVSLCRVGPAFYNMQAAHTSGQARSGTLAGTCLMQRA